MVRLVLWDVDGTLLTSGGVGPAAIHRAVELGSGRELVGTSLAGEVRMGGKTDPQIVGEYLAMMDTDTDLAVVLGHLEECLAATAHLVTQQGAVLPGVEAVLEDLAGRPGVVSSVLTGNIAPNAKLKLGAFGLDRWLDLEVGAYGSDNIDRRALVAISVHRVTRLRGLAVTPDEVWVVGDTPRDLEAARSGGAHCVLVATGGYGIEQLETLGADATISDLSDTDQVVALLTG
ncbi:MAG: HAD family hydrolase [Acidimicrobiales bacterium]